MTPLCELAIKYGTDKVIWGYTPFYFERLKGRNIKRVLEIGICGDRDIPNNRTGASLYMWAEFFPNAAIFGIDNDKRWMVNDGRITSFCADAYNTDQLNAALQAFGPEDFDFIVDDAVHDPHPQIKLLLDLFPHLAPAGLYAMEDVCPYKMPFDNLNNMIKFFPVGSHCDIISTHKAEKLLLIQR